MIFENWSNGDAFYESDTDFYTESDDSFDSYDRDDTDNIFSRRRRVNNARPAQPRRFDRSPNRPYHNSGTINTPAGQAKVELPKDLVSKQEFQELEKKVLSLNNDNIANAKAISVLNTNTKKLDDGLASVSKGNNDVKKQISGIKQGQMFSALLPPKITEVTLQGPTPPGGTAPAPEIKSVTNTKLDMLTSLLPMMVSGGLGGGSGSSSGGNDNNMMMMLPMVLLLQDKDKNSAGSSNDNSTLLLVMMMMMMNNK